MLLELLTGRPPRNEETKEPLIESVYVPMQDPKRHMSGLVDARAGAWNAKAWRKLVAIAWRCLQERVADRARMTDVVGEVDALAGRGPRQRRWLGRF